MIEIKIETRKVEYNLRIHGKYTILLGESGSGKTRLARDVYTLNRIQPDALYSGYKVYSVPAGQNVDTDIFSDSDAIIIFDEDLDQKDILKFFPTIKQSRNYFIFIGRGLSFIPYGIEDVFEMVGNKRHMSMQQAYHFPKLNVASYNLLCEDAKSGATITEKIFNKYGYTVYSAAGKDNIVNKLKDLRLDNVVVLADLCGIGFFLDVLHSHCYKRPGITVYNSKSFEYELLANPLIDRTDLRDPDPPTLLVAESEESYYTSAVSTVLKEKYEISYAKSSDAVLNFLVTGYIQVSNRHLKFPTPVPDTWLYPALPRTVAPTLILSSVHLDGEMLELNYADGNRVECDISSLNLTAEERNAVRTSGTAISFGNRSFYLQQILALSGPTL